MKGALLAWARCSQGTNTETMDICATNVYQIERKAPGFSYGDRSESFKGGLGEGGISRHTLFRAKRIASLSEVRP